MGCGTSKFDHENGDPKLLHLQVRKREAAACSRIPSSKSKIDDDDDRDLTGNVSARKNFVLPKNVVVFVPSPSVQVVYGGDSSPEERDDSISCNPGSPSFRDYCAAAHESDGDDAEEGLGRKHETMSSTKEELLNRPRKGSERRSTRRRRGVKGLKSVLQRSHRKT